MNDEQWFKVLVAGRSCHGGDLVWSLPRANDDGSFRPGDWHAVAGDLRLCKVGLHLTTEPARWLLVGCEAYRAEGERPGRRDGDKQVFGRARLLAPAPEAIPVWWRRVETFVRDDLPRWDFRKPLARDAARDAARGAAWDAAWDAAQGAAQGAAWGAARGAAQGAAWGAALNAAWDAALYCCVEVLCADLDIPEEHRQFVRALRAHYVTED